MKKRTLITSALPYANGYIHLGHAAGAYLPADIFARFQRISGNEVLYVCGSDEHGVAITISAEKEKVSPQSIVDKYHNANKDAFNKFSMSFDIYSRTSLPEHHQTAREFFEDFLKKGFLKEKEEEQFYDSSAGMFLPDRYVEGECPNCGYDRARGDQCDSCGAYYNQLELKNPVSIVSGKKPEVRKTSHWYYEFNKFQEFLENYIEGKKGKWKDNVINQTMSWLKAGLNERAITRDMSWGVNLEGIEGLSKEKTAGKVLYVWFDAVFGYISASKIWSETHKQDWKRWWCSEDTRYIAFIGKDNIVFHTLIFPAYLHAKGDYILPDNVPANEFLNLEGEKFSKSRNWSIDLKDFFNDFPETQYTDSLRYTLAMNLPETKDADFTWKDFQARNNNELAAILGNFVNRALQFIFKNFEGKVPVLSSDFSDLPTDWGKLAIGSDDEFKERFIEKYSKNDFDVINALITGIKSSSELFERFRFRDAITEIMNVARASNKYFNDEEPWKRIKSDKDYAAKTLYVCVQLVRSLAVLVAPIIPNSSTKIAETLNISIYSGAPSEDSINTTNLWDSASLPLVEQGSDLNTPAILFTRIEDDVISAQIAKLGDKISNSTIAPEPLIDITDFQKIKLKTAKIISAEKLKKSKKLLKLIVDLGDSQRQILAGIAEYYEPEYLIGKTVVVVANLKPAKLMGEESQGMMLAASADNKLCFVSPEIEIGAGAEVK
ncbi:MAG: methionine--tRNA ligase [Candidatus Kapabacteria bacterium]|nr:methionine--tRNA ligase [Ignavibacteriota bacterium]MCW5885095.1 methionine--tRNA ligase [Candidatus Kapabacteria bacterium]